MTEDKTTFLSRIRIQGNEIFADSREYLNRLYGNVGSVFTPASPYGQLLRVVSNIGMLILLYLEDVATANNFITASNIEDIYGIAQLAGHDPYRGVAAKGEVKFKFKPGKESSFEGPHITINDGTLLRCLNNNLPYTMKLATGEIRIKKGEVDFTSAVIVQGEYKSQKLQGSGKSMQTFNVNIPSTIDHDDIKVFVNGKLWKKYNSIYDMAGNNVEGVLVRTGLSGGIDLIFGNGYFGKVPEFGAIIEVIYLENAGSGGIIDTGSASIVFKFEDPGFDFRGDEVDLSETFILQCTTPPRLGADPENTDFTKYIAPLASKSFALVSPDNYEYFLARYNTFSYIDAYNTANDEYLDDDNVTYLFILPDVNRKITSDIDYFTLPENEFTLDSIEKKAIRAAINESGQQGTTSEVTIVDPTVRRYALNIVLRYFDGYDIDVLRNNIRTKLSEYFLSVKRRDKIPKSDIVAMIEAVEGIDSVNVFFVSEQNEAAIRNGYYIKSTSKVSPTTPFLQEGEGGKKRYVFFNKEVIDTKVNLLPGEDPRLGLDEFGDISISDQELPIIRGGWSDRNDTYYNEFPVNGQPSSLSIYFKEKIKSTLNTRIQSENKKKLT
jgi:hypothetical protein